WQKAWSRDPQYELIFTRWLPSFHPSGERFVTSKAAVGSTMASLVLAETGTNASHVLYDGQGKSAMAAQWSPTGDTIIFGLASFFTIRDRGAQVAIIKPDGTGFRQVTSGKNNNGFPSLSPDGKRFVYRTTGPEGQGLRIMNLEDSAVVELTTGY